MVCVTVINNSRTDDSNEQVMKYNCCDMHREPRTGQARIRCDEKVDVGNWVATVNMIFIFLSIF